MVVYSQMCMLISNRKSGQVLLYTDVCALNLSHCPDPRGQGCLHGSITNAIVNKKFPKKKIELNYQVAGMKTKGHILIVHQHRQICAYHFNTTQTHKIVHTSCGLEAIL